MKVLKIALIVYTIFSTTTAKPVEDDVEFAPRHDCEVGGNVYPSKGHFFLPDNPCKFCICIDGTIECDTIQCDYIPNCTPEYDRKLCCPKFTNCTDPSYEGVETQNERQFVEDQEEKNLPVVQVQHLDLISTLSANPTAGSSGVFDEFTKDVVAATESSVEAPTQAEDFQEADEPEAMESRIDDEIATTDAVPIKLREGDFEIFATTLVPLEELLKSVKDETEFATVEPRFDDAEINSSSEEEQEEINVTENYSSALKSGSAEESTEEPTEEPEFNSITEGTEISEMKSSSDDGFELNEIYSRTTTENSLTTTSYEGLSTIFENPPKVPDVIVGKIMQEDEAKVTELNAEVLVQDSPKAQKTSEAVVLTTTTDPEEVETVSIASAESPGSASAEIRLEEKKKNSSAELKIFQVLYSEDEKQETSRSADAAMFYLPQLPRPLVSPPAAALTPSEWKANAFDETKEEIIAGLWHEALDILTGGRSAARSQARKTHNSKFHRD